MIDKIKDIEAKYERLSSQLCNPDLIGNTEEYKRIAKERASLKEIVETGALYKAALIELEEAKELIKGEEDSQMKCFLKDEIESLTGKVSKLKEEIVLLLLPKDVFEDKNIIMEIRAGAGGEEAALFAGDLYRMYIRFAEKQRWKAEVLSGNPTGLGGVKEVIFSVTGDKVYPNLKYESGVHRVQRVPRTESSGRIHTSTITVAVLPEAEEFDVKINPADLKIDTYRASGAGGQHVNKTDSAVRITHLPTGVVVACQDERSQHQNREKAFRILRARLLERLKNEHEKAIASSRKSQVGTGDRAEKIRTYNFPQGRVTDHRVSLTVHNLEQILDGQLDEIIKVLKENEKKEKLESAGK